MGAVFQGALLALIYGMLVAVQGAVDGFALYFVVAGGGARAARAVVLGRDRRVVVKDA